MDKDEKKLIDFQKQKEQADKMLLNVEIVLGNLLIFFHLYPYFSP